MNTNLKGLEQLPAGTPLRLRNGQTVYKSAHSGGTYKDTGGFVWCFYVPRIEDALKNPNESVTSFGSNNGLWGGDVWSGQTNRDVVAILPVPASNPLEARVDALSKELEELKASLKKPEPAPAPVPAALLPHQTEKGVSLEGCKVGDRVKLTDGSVVEIVDFSCEDTIVVLENGRSAWKSCGRGHLKLNRTNIIVTEIVAAAPAPVVEKWIPKAGTYHVKMGPGGIKAKLSSGTPAFVVEDRAAAGLSYPNKEAAEEAAKRLAFWARLMALACELNGGTIGGDAGIRFSGLWEPYQLGQDDGHTPSIVFKDFETAQKAADIANRDGWQPVSNK